MADRGARPAHPHRSTSCDMASMNASSPRSIPASALRRKRLDELQIYSSADLNRIPSKPADAETGRTLGSLDLELDLDVAAGRVGIRADLFVRLVVAVAAAGGGRGRGEQRFDRHDACAPS